MEEDSGKDKVERLFEAALARPEEERKAFLRETCSDAALREEVASLVEAYEEAPAFFERTCLLGGRPDAG